MDTDTTIAVKPTRFDYLKSSFEDRIKNDKKELDKFVERFNQDPRHALSWSNDLFKVAARYTYCKEILALLEEKGEGFIETAARQLFNDMRSSARYGVMRSTSVSSNLADEAKMMAAAELHDYLESYLRHSKLLEFTASVVLPNWVLVGRDSARLDVEGIGRIVVARRTLNSKFFDAQLYVGDKNELESGKERQVQDVIKGCQSFAAAQNYCVERAKLMLWDKKLQAEG